MKRDFFGLSLIIASIFLFAFNAFTFTGAAIGVFSQSSNLVALAFLILGLALSLREQQEGNLASELLRSRAVITDPKKLIRTAEKMGYDERNVKEGYQILGENGKPLTVIPRHHISNGVSKNILKALSTGESSFRRYQQYKSA
jgi:hypothetical protein